MQDNNTLSTLMNTGSKKNAKLMQIVNHNSYIFLANIPAKYKIIKHLQYHLASDP
jgi:hypothetical protein